MTPGYIQRLKQPCINRQVELIDNKDGSISLDGKRFETIKETENYLESKTRKDIPA